MAIEPKSRLQACPRLSRLSRLSLSEAEIYERCCSAERVSLGLVALECVAKPLLRCLCSPQAEVFEAEFGQVGCCCESATQASVENECLLEVANCVAVASQHTMDSSQRHETVCFSGAVVLVPEAAQGQAKADQRLGVAAGGECFESVFVLTLAGGGRHRGTGGRACRSRPSSRARPTEQAGAEKRKPPHRGDQSASRESSSRAASRLGSRSTARRNASRARGMSLRSR